MHACIQVEADVEHVCHTPLMTPVLGLESRAAAPTWREPEGQSSTWRARRALCGVRGCTGGSW